MRCFFAATTIVFLLSAPVNATPPKVAADILPIHSLVSRVMDGVSSPALIVGPGASPHNHALRPSEARALGNAEIVFWAGETLSPWLSDPFDSLAQGARKVNLLQVQGVLLLDLRESSDDGPTDHAHSHDHQKDEHGHDPHAWLEPKNAMIWLDEIARVMSEADPANAQAYAANAIAGRADISARIPSSLSGTSTKHAVYHDAYQYFEASLGLGAPIMISTSDASAPGAAHLQEVKDRFAEEDINCLFAEPGYSKPLAERLVEGVNIRIIELDPLGSEFEMGPNLYSDILEAMASAFESCSK